MAMNKESALEAFKKKHPKTYKRIVELSVAVWSRPVEPLEQVKTEAFVELAKTVRQLEFRYIQALGIVVRVKRPVVRPVSDSVILAWAQGVSVNHAKASLSQDKSRRHLPASNALIIH